MLAGETAGSGIGGVIIVGGSGVGSMVRPVSRAPLPPGVPMLAWASLKYSAKPFSVSLSALLISQSRRKNAIIAVTKSA